MSAAAVMQPQKSPEKSSGLWNRLKKNLNLREPNGELVVQRRNPLDPRQMNGGDGIRRNKSQGDFMRDQYSSTNGSSHTLGRQNSLKSVQLQLANFDHENNILNSKPMPKKILPQQYYQDSRRAPDCNGNRKELRRAATMSTISQSGFTRQGSEKSYSTHSSDHLSVTRPSNSPNSGPSRSPIDSHAAMPHKLGSKVLWGKVRQQYAPTALTLDNEPPMPKLATFTQLWDTIFSIVKENGMLDLDEPDPRLWWRKVFLNLRHRHGKGKNTYICAYILGQLMT